MPLHEPSGHRVIQLRKMSREEVVPAGDDLHFCIFSNVRRKSLDHCAQLIGGPNRSNSPDTSSFGLSQRSR